MDSAKFTKFTQADYDAVFAKLKTNTVNIMSDTNASGAPVAVSDIPVSAVAIREVK